MEFFFVLLVIYLAIMIPGYFLIQHMVRRCYRDLWVNRGREWRLKGYDYYELDTPWIKKFFDEGYYEIDRILEDLDYKESE